MHEFVDPLRQAGRLETSSCTYRKSLYSLWKTLSPLAHFLTFPAYFLTFNFA